MINQQIAATILQQLGDNEFRVMTGAKNFVAIESGLQFDLPKYPGLKINRVVITLNDRDTYDVQFGRISKKKDAVYGVTMPTYEALFFLNDVYADSLRKTFTSMTGLDTRL
jgi:hypothetical protein